MKLKVMTVVGTRPEIIRLSRVISALDTSNSVEHIFVHTGQNYDYELNEIFFVDLKIRKPDYFLESSAPGVMETIGNILRNIDVILEKERPQAVLLLGDTNSCLSSIAAKKRQIPIFHMEAGNRCYDQRVPEETNRKIVDHISDINLTYSDIAREYLLKEGIPADRIIKTGSPMYEVLIHNMAQLNNSNVLSRLNLSEKGYFLVSAHREENINNEKNFTDLMESLNNIALKFNLPVIVSTHPRTRKMIDLKKVAMHQNVQFLKPLGFFDYNALQMKSYAVLSDSGTISEESSILNFKALNIRNAHERPEAMEESAVMMVGLKSERIMQGLVQLECQKTGDERNINIVRDYTMPNVSEKVVRIILSYTDYVNSNVWKKH